MSCSRALTTLQLAVFRFIGAAPADSIEFVKEHDDRTPAGEFKDLGQVGRRLAEVGRDNGLEANHGKRQVKLAGQRLGGHGLSTTRRPAKQKLVAG